MTFAVVGKPGSGKTYYAVNYAVNNIKKYVSVLHNINKLSKFDRLSNEDFYNKFIKLRQYFLKVNDKENVDDLVKEKMHEIGLYENMLIIVDEAQNHLNIYQNKEFFYAFEWFMSYSRHLQIDTILLMQNVKKLQDNLASLVEYFVRAIPESEKLMSHVLTYEIYREPPEETKLKFIKPYSKTKIIKDQKIFEMFESGGRIDTNGFNIFRKFYWIFGILGVLLIISVYNVYLRFYEKDKKENTKIEKYIQKNTKKTKNKYYKENKKNFDVVVCRGNKCYFHKNNFKFNKDLLMAYLNTNNVKFKKIKNNKYIIFFNDNKTFYNNFRMNESKENKNINNIITKELQGWKEGLMK